MEEGGGTCSGSWRVVHPRDGRPFIGCSGWRAGDPPTRSGGHFSCKIKDGVDPDMLSKYNEDGPPAEPTDVAEQFALIAPKHHKGKTCSRHGGDEPALVRAGDGRCSVRARLLYPAEVSDPDSIRVVLILSGEHNHKYPACKLPVSAIESAVAENPNASVRVLQVRLGVTHVFAT